MGKRRAAWALWLIAAALLWFFENNAATLTLLIASALLPVLFILAAQHGAKKLRLKLSVPQAGAKRSSITASLSVEAAGVFCRVAGRISCLNSLTGEQTEAAFSLAPKRRGESTLTLTADTTHCGILRFHPAAYAEDIFGLWRSKELPCEDEFAVIEPELFLPRVSLTENTTVITEGEQYSQTKPGSDPSETFGIRAYIPGDPIRQIHWKLSLKSDDLLLRELGLPVVNKTLLVFRNTLGEEETLHPAHADAMAEVFLSISHMLVSDGLIHTAAFVQDGQYLLTEVQNASDLHAMEARFLALRWEAEDGALGRLLTETPYAHVAVVSPVLPPDSESFCRGNRVTVLTPAPGQAVSGIHTIAFTSEGYSEELQVIEL